MKGVFSFIVCVHPGFRFSKSKILFGPTFRFGILSFRVLNELKPKVSFNLNLKLRLTFFPSFQLEISEGFVRLSIDEVYQIVAQMFTEKLIAHIEKQNRSLLRNVAVVSDLSDTFAKRIQPKRIPLISLEDFDQLSDRSFPPCMFRILKVFKQSQALTFKAQFEFSLF
jgi:hypothetical protein